MTESDIRSRLCNIISKELNLRKSIEIDIRVIPDRIQIDISNESNKSEIYDTLCAVADNDDWKEYCLYIKRVREDIFNLAREHGMQVEVTLVMYGWTNYKLKYA